MYVCMFVTFNKPSTNWGCNRTAVLLSSSESVTYSVPGNEKHKAKRQRNH